mmetsp:Transcript_9374/g.16341  ORF Transcript_9374/g.16341 Transcript_9374/m.16341 type:complete len:113 (-) Transcript_9374:37-375(-)
MKYKQQQHDKKKQRMNELHDDKSISDDTIDEVKRAIQKFKEHARALGVQERDLMEAVRDDDRSIPSAKHKKSARPKHAHKDTSTNTNSGVTDKFIEMFDYFFVPQPAHSSEI